MIINRGSASCQKLGGLGGGGHVQKYNLCSSNISFPVFQLLSSPRGCQKHGGSCPLPSEKLQNSFIFLLFCPKIVASAPIALHCFWHPCFPSSFSHQIQMTRKLMIQKSGVGWGTHPPHGMALPLITIYYISNFLPIDKAISIFHIEPFHSSSYLGG